MFNISDVTQSSDHAELSSVSQLIKGKSGNLQKLLKYFNEITTFVFNALLSVAASSVIFVLY